MREVNRWRCELIRSPGINGEEPWWAVTAHLFKNEEVSAETSWKKTKKEAIEEMTSIVKGIVFYGPDNEEM